MTAGAFQVIFDGKELPVTDVQLPTTPVTDHINNMKAWLDAATGWEPGKLTEIFVLPSRGYSKSVFRDLHLQRPRPAVTTTSTAPEGMRGENPIMILLDEFARFEAPFRQPADKFDIRDWFYQPVEGRAALYPGDIIAKFEHPDHPDCTTFATLEKVDRRDPLNPNPAAGTIRRFYVVRDGRTEQVKNKTAALAKAETMHKRLIAEKHARQKEMERQRAIAAERAVEEARRNHDHLVSLPAFGGF